MGKTSSRRTRLLAVATTAGLTMAGAWVAGPAQAGKPAPVPTPVANYLATTALPDPSEALAIDTSTGTVYAMTESESDTGGEVGVDAVANPAFASAGQVTAADCGEDQHDIAIIDPSTNQVTGYIAVSGEAEYMAVDPQLHKLYVPQYNDEGPAAPQCLAVVDLASASHDVTYYSIPFTYKDTGYQYDPTGVAVDTTTHVAYLGGKMPEVEGDAEGGEGVIMAFDGSAGKFIDAVAPAGDDPESVAFNHSAGANGRVYAANEDEGTLSIAPAIYLGTSGAWRTGTFAASTMKLGPIFDASECPAGTYQPAEADKLAVDEITNMVYLTDDRFRLAAIKGNATDLTGVQILRLSPNGTCPTSPVPEVYNYANNIAIDPYLGSVINRSGTRGGLAYVTTENWQVSIVDLKSFTKVSTFGIEDNLGRAVHIDWPIVNPYTDPDRFYVTDEQRTAVYVYELGDALSPLAK
ncbi:MAG TPA: hypothetical protein VFH66_00825 [Mycobacteriales bacterium]|nr:hypothetical protein [Mycobacteriales bacterium]